MLQATVLFHHLTQLIELTFPPFICVISDMINETIVACGLAFLASSAALLLSNRKHRNLILTRLRLGHTRTSGSLTPPRSLSLEKQDLTANEPPKYPEYGDVFPPSRRHVLAELSTAIPSSGATSTKSLSPDYSERIPSCENVDSDALHDHVTPTGFTVGEIKQLGDFPDYAALSGVPLPIPYPEFEIETAMPRPFRPFRWAYHQTMCESDVQLFRK